MAAIDPSKMTATQMREAMRELRDYQARRNAFLRSIDAVYGEADLAELRREYGLEEQA